MQNNKKRPHPAAIKLRDEKMDIIENSSKFESYLKNHQFSVLYDEML